MHCNRPSFLFAVLTWSLLILRFGYQYGTGDQVELLPYTLFLHDHTLYPHDFFIQGLNADLPNERTVMAHLLLPFVNHLEVFCFVFQFLCTVVLVMGLQKLAFRFIQNKYFAWLAILVSMVVLNDYTLGNVELYSECFQASGLSVAIIVWAINFFLDRKFRVAAVLMSLATFIQLLEGLDVMIVLSVILLFMVATKQANLKTLITFGAVYSFTAGVYLIFIFAAKQGKSAFNSEQLFQVLFEFRHPHHFIFTKFPIKKTVVFFMLALFALVFYSRRSSKVFEFVLIGLFGIVFYALAVDDFHNIFIGNFQFYKVTIWIKFLGVVAAVGLAEEYYMAKIKINFPGKFEIPAIAIAILFCWVVVLKFNNYLPYHVPFQLFGMKEKDDMVAICEKIKEVTPKDAVFIQPFENSELKFYAQRSSFVEFKANVRNKKFVEEWYHRIQRVYGVSVQDPEKGFALQQKADDNYYTQNAWRYMLRQGFGITHMLVKKEYKPLTGTLILANDSYAVYQL